MTRLVAESGPGGGIVLTNSVGRPWLAYDALAAAPADLIHLRIEGHSDGTPRSTTRSTPASASRC